MNNDNFSTVLIQDPRLLVNDKVKYAVIKGSAQNTQVSYKALSSSNSQIVFNVPTPSESIIIDRNIMIGATIKLNFNITESATNIIPNGAVVFSYGNTDSAQVFPLQSLMSVITATINNTSVNINLQDVLAQMLLINDPEELHAYNGGTNTLSDDTWLNYSDAINASSNPLGGFIDTNYNMNIIGRGCLPATIIPLSGSNFMHTFFDATGAAVSDNSFIKETASTNNIWNFSVIFRVLEPLLLSPFLFGDCQYNSQGIYGIQNLNFQFNVANTNRVWSSATTYINSITLDSQNPFTNCNMMINYLTPQPSQLLKSRNVVPYYSMPRYLSTAGSNSAMLPTTISPGASYNYTTVTGVNLNTVTIISPNIQLNQIPDKLIIVVRVPMTQQNWKNSSSFACIYNINLSFNNAAGLCSTFSQYDLYRMSRENGSTQTWSQFCGFGNANNAKTNGSSAASGDGDIGGFTPVATTGSLLILQFGKDIQLNDYYASGSLGNFNLMFTLSCYNQYIDYGNTGEGAIANPELCLITLNSGVFVNDRGTSQIYEGLLTKEDVLKTSAYMPYTRHDVNRLVGGNINDAIKSAYPHMLRHKYERGGDMGMAVSGGDMGMATSGGNMHQKHMKLKKHLK